MRSTIKTLIAVSFATSLLAGCNSATTGGGFGFNDIRNLAGTAAGGVGGGMLANSLTKNSKWNKWAVGAGAVAGAALGNNVMNSLDAGDAAAQQNALMQQQMAMMAQQQQLRGREMFLSTNTPNQIVVQPQVMPPAAYYSGYQQTQGQGCQRVQVGPGIAWACPAGNGRWVIQE